MKANQRAVRADDAVSEIIGSILLIGITILLVGGLAVLIFSVDPPQDELHADLSVIVARGADGVWDSGDEQIRVLHEGGETVPADGFSIQIDVGGTVLAFGGPGLGDTFSDGMFTIGETWTTITTVPEEADVRVQMIITTEGFTYLLQDRLVKAGSSCDPDGNAPTASGWQQTPGDVSSASIGAVTITANILDPCSGVNTGLAPHLEWRINDGTDPAFTDAGAMTAGASNTWTGTIPAQTWTLLNGQTLQYKFTGMTDLAGNSADSTVQSDLIQLIGSTVYVNANTATEGTVSNFANAQSASDGGATALLTETPGTPPVVRYGSGTSGSSGGSGGAGSGSGAPDNGYYRLNSDGDTQEVNSFSNADAGTIVKVEMVFEGQTVGTRVDDSVDLQVRPGSLLGLGAFTTVYNDYVPPTGADGQQIVDITGLEASWTWNEIGDTELRAVYDRGGGGDDSNLEFYVDALWLIITVSGGGTELDVTMDFPAPAFGLTNALEIRYAASGDVFNVQVWDGSTWNTRGVTMDQGAMTNWNYALTAGEATAQGGAPRIRFIDGDMSSPQGTLQLDYVRVVTT